MGARKLSYNKEIAKKKLELISKGNIGYFFYSACPVHTELPNRHEAGNEYRYGVQGQEKDDEVSGEGNNYTAEFWQYDSRLGRRWNIDPVVKEHESPYATFANNPIWFADPNGADSINSNGVWKWNVESGDRYWKISQKTGVSVDDLREWNGYKDRAIPKNVNFNLSDPSKTVPLGENVGSYKLIIYGHVEERGEHVGTVYGPPIVMNFVSSNENLDESNIQTVQTVSTNVDWETYGNASNWQQVDNLELKETQFVDGNNLVGNGMNVPRFYGNSIMGALPNFGDYPGIPSNQSGTTYFYVETSVVLKTVNGDYIRLGTFSWGYQIHSDGSNTLIPFKIVTSPTQYHINAVEGVNE